MFPSMTDPEQPEEMSFDELTEKVKILEGSADQDTAMYVGHRLIEAANQNTENAAMVRQYLRKSYRTMRYVGRVRLISMCFAIEGLADLILYALQNDSVDSIRTSIMERIFDDRLSALYEGLWGVALAPSDDSLVPIAIAMLEQLLDERLGVGDTDDYFQPNEDDPLWIEERFGDESQRDFGDETL